MPDETNAQETTTATETNAPQAPATPAPQTITMTVEEYEAKLNERAAQTRRALQAKEQKQAEPPKAKKQDETTATGLSSDDVQSMMRRQSAFDRAIGKAQLDDEQTSIIETLFQVEKPQDIAEWVSRKAKAFGSTKPPSAPHAAQATVPTPSATPQPATPGPTHPAPAATNMAGPPQSILDWSRDQMNQWLKSKGASAANPYSPAYRKAAREIRERFLADGAEVRIISPK